MSCYRPVTGYRLLLVICVALLLGLLPIFLFSKSASSVGTLTSGFTQTTFAGGRPSPLTNTTAMDLAPDGRLLVAEQVDTMQVANTDGTLQDPPFFDISSKVNAAGERGLWVSLSTPTLILPSPPPTTHPSTTLPQTPRTQSRLTLSG